MQPAMGEGVQIRPFRPADQVAAKALILAGMAHYWGRVDPMLNPDLNDIATSYANGTFLVAEENGRIIGTGALMPEADRVGRIVRMSVAAGQRRRGMGRRILQALCRIAVRNDYCQLVLETTSTWHGAIAFYQSGGFRIVAERDGDTHMEKQVVVEPMQPTDWPAVAAIYREGIATGHATFETAVPTWETWHADHLPIGRFVARQNEHVVGWAALSPVSARCVYAGVVEVSVYVAVAARGYGVGTALLQALVAASEAEGIWTLQAGIFPENEASIALHRRCGFRIVGRRERLGKLADAWRDVLLLERRSQLVGSE